MTAIFLAYCIGAVLGVLFVFLPAVFWLFLHVIEELIKWEDALG